MLQETAIYRKFIVSILISLFASIVFILAIVTAANRKLIHDQAIGQARILFSSITLARAWNASYGGVYVEKKPGIESNPFLESPDVRTADGRIFTKRNPATMTREISALAEKERLFRFHITSLNLLNPANRPDAFELEALSAFGRGEQEFFRFETLNRRSTFRYMAPLFIEAACLQCHSRQGYALGDVRGGISITFDTRDISRIEKKNALLVGSIGALGGLLVIFITVFFTRRLLREISAARELIETMASTDELTGLFNRRQLLTRFDEEFSRAQRQGRPLSTIMLDIDLFKQVNDSFGHLVGDSILRTVAKVLKTTVRTYDICGRYGGEEFLVVLPETALSDAVQLAERVRTGVRQYFGSISNPDQPGTVTVSLGVASFGPDDESIESIIRRADEGLYRAKAAGRDQVATIAE